MGMLMVPIIFISTSIAIAQAQKLYREGGVPVGTFAVEGGAPAPKALPLPTPLAYNSCTYSRGHQIEVSVLFA